MCGGNYESDAVRASLLLFPTQTELITFGRQTADCVRSHGYMEQQTPPEMRWNRPKKLCGVIGFQILWLLITISVCSELMSILWWQIHRQMHEGWRCSGSSGSSLIRTRSEAAFIPHIWLKRCLTFAWWAEGFGQPNVSKPACLDPQNKGVIFC